MPDCCQLFTGNYQLVKNADCVWTSSNGIATLTQTSATTATLIMNSGTATATYVSTNFTCTGGTFNILTTNCDQYQPTININLCSSGSSSSSRSSSSSKSSSKSSVSVVSACGCSVPTVLYATISAGLGGCVGLFGDSCMYGITFTLTYNPATGKWEAPGDIPFSPACTGAPAHTIQKPILYCDPFTHQFGWEGGPDIPSPNDCGGSTYCSWNGSAANYSEEHTCNPFSIDFELVDEFCCCDGHIRIIVTS